MNNVIKNVMQEPDGWKNLCLHSDCHCKTAGFGFIHLSALPSDSQSGKWRPAEYLSRDSTRSKLQYTKALTRSSHCRELRQKEKRRNSASTQDITGPSKKCPPTNQFRLNRRKHVAMQDWIGHGTCAVNAARHLQFRTMHQQAWRNMMLHVDHEATIVVSRYSPSISNKYNLRALS